MLYLELADHMARRLFLALVLVAVAAITGSPCWGAENVLVNPCFTAAEGGMPPPGWTIYGQIGEGGGVTVIDGDDPAKRGLLVVDNVAINRGAEGETGLWQALKAGPGPYKLTAQIKAVPGVSSEGAFLQLRFVPSKEFVQVPVAVTDTKNYVEVSATAEAPADTTGIEVYLYTQAYAAPQFIVRSLELLAGSPAADGGAAAPKPEEAAKPVEAPKPAATATSGGMLMNPNFTDAETRMPPAGWSRYGDIGEGGSITVVDAEDPARRALLVVDNVAISRGSEGETGLSQTVAAAPGLSYKVTALIKAAPDASSEGAYLQLRFLPSNEFHQVPLAVVNTEKFIETTIAAVSPADTTAITIYVWTQAHATPQFLIQSVELTEGEVGGMPVPTPPVYSELKELHRETALVRSGRSQAYIVAPASGIYDAAAFGIQEAIAARTGVEIPVISDNDPRAQVNVPEYWTGPNLLRSTTDTALKMPALRANLIVLGNRSTNKTINTLYDLYFTLLDLKYPGPSGYELRSLHSPFGDGKNVIFVGGSDAEGVALAAASLVEHIGLRGGRGALTLDWMMEVRLGRGVTVPDDPEEVQTWEASESYGSTGYFGWNSISKRLALYYMTGEEHYAREALAIAFPDEETKQWIFATDGEMIENKDDPLAGPYHYNAHMMILFWDLVEESPVFTDAERLKVTNAFSRQLDHRKGEGIYGQNAPVRVGDRHEQWSAISLYALGRYFQKEYGDRVWDYAVYGALNHFGSLYKYGSVRGESDNLYWYSTGIAPIFTYLVMSGDRYPVTNGVVGDLLTVQEILISGRVPDWALGYASLGYLNKAAYVTGDGRWLTYRQRMRMDTDVFRLGQSFWPDESLVPADPVDLVDKWSVGYLTSVDWSRRQDGLALEESFGNASYRSAVDDTGDFILIDGFNGASRNPYHALAVLELRLKGETLLKGYNNQVLTKADGLVAPHVPMNAALKAAEVVGGTAAMVAEVPNASFAGWRRSLIQRVGRYALFVDGLTFREKAGNMEVQIKWELESGAGANLIQSSEPMEISQAGRIQTHTWSGAVEPGQQRHFFTLLSVGGEPCYAVAANAAALALPEPALALAGRYGGSAAEVAVLGSDHAFGLGVSALGLSGSLLAAEHPIDVDWDYATGVVTIVAEQETLVRLALQHSEVTVNGVDRKLEPTAEGLASVRLPAGRHEMGRAVPEATAAGKTRTALQALLGEGIDQRKAAQLAAKGAQGQQLPSLMRVMASELGEKITDMTILDSSEGPLLAVSCGKTIRLLSADGQTVQQMQADGRVLLLRWWPEHQLLLAGCADEKVIAFDTLGRRQWVFVSEMDPEVLRAGKQYWFKDAPGQSGIHGLFTGVFLDGKSQAFIGSACTMEVIDERGQLIKRFPVFWGLPSVFTIIPGPNDSLNLLAGMKYNGFNYVKIINNNTLHANNEGFFTAPAGATVVDGWSALNRHHLFYEDLAGEGEKLVIGDINGVYNRVTAWDDNGRARYDAAFGPGADFNGAGWRLDHYDNRNIRDMSVADLDGDGTKEVVVALWGGHVLALDYQLRKTWAVKLASPPTVMRILPSSAGASTQIIVGSEDGTVSLLSHQGQLVKTAQIKGVPTFVEVLESTAGAQTIMIGTHLGALCAFVDTDRAWQISVRSPAASKALEGVVSLDFSVVRQDGIAIQECTVDFGGQRIYSGQEVPPAGAYSIDTYDFANGMYDMVIRVVDAEGVFVTDTIPYRVRNWVDFVDDLTPAATSTWFDMSLTVAESPGWTYADTPSSLFADAGRKVRQADTKEYLVWEAPRMRNFSVIIYARHRKPLGSVSVAVSPDGETWRDMAYDMQLLEESPDGWMKLGLSGGVPDGLQARRFRLICEDFPADELQVGQLILERK